MELLDFTEELKAPHIRWTVAPTAFVAQFPPRVCAVRVGLYALLVTNDCALPIYDRNGAGKVIVPANGSALKSGKFEDGLLRRERQNYAHYHRRTTDGEEGELFPGVLHLLLVADLTLTRAGSDRGLLRRIETAWNRRTRELLLVGGYGDPEQPGRSESRWIPGDPPTRDEIHNAMSEMLDQHSDLL